MIASLFILGLLILFTFAVWILLNLVGGMLLTLMGNQTVTGMTLSQFLANFIGSPISYVYLADLIFLAISTLFLILSRKTEKKQK